MNAPKVRRPARSQTCPVCRTRFKAYVSQKRKFCSKACRAEAERVPKVDYKLRKGYRVLYVGRDHPMADGDGNAYEHRIVLAGRLGRTLSRDEHVHHVNGDRLDNRADNLELTTAGAHAAHHRKLEVPGWSRSHDRCVRCGTTEREHAGHGLCRRCYMRDWHAR